MRGVESLSPADLDLDELRERVDTEVVYVPGAVNRYKYEFDVVVLDRELKAYPVAHDHILKHELLHAIHARPENRGLLQFVALELKNDLERYTGTHDEIEACRRYKRERGGESRMRWRDRRRNGIGNTARTWWCLGLAPFGTAYRALRGAVGRFRGGLRG
jgi:hypothetical protein